jgi:hypothetical protein
MYLKTLFIAIFLLGIVETQAQLKLRVLEEYFWVDTSASLSFQEIVNKPFEPIKTQYYLNCSTCNYWFRFKVRNTSNVKEGIMLPTNYIANGELYYICPDQKRYVSTEKIGFHLTFPEENTYFYPNFNFKLTDSLNYYYLRFQPIEGNHLNPYITGFANVSDNQYLMNYTNRQYVYMAIILSIIGVVAFFTLLVFFMIKQQMYLWYFLYLISAIFFILTIYNIPFRYTYFLKFDMWRMLDSYALFYSMMTVFLLLYSRSFLNLATHSKFLYNWLTVMCVVKIVIFFCGVFFNEYMSYFVFSNSYFHNPIIDLCCICSAFVAGIYRLWKGDKFARYFLIAFSIIFCGFIFQGFGLTARFSLIRQMNSGFMSNALFELITFEVLLFTIALADRFRILRRENELATKKMIFQLEENTKLKEKINKELEMKVAERTLEIKQQAEEISRMNQLLVNHNLKLESDVKVLTKSKVTHQAVSFEEFKITYPDEGACFKYLADLKWSKGFTCRKCGNNSFIAGKNEFSKRCNKCWHEETPTADTIFHKLKFPIEKAFYLLFLVTNNKKISIEELANTLSLSERTCWSYKNKIMGAIQSNRKSKSTDSWDAIIKE